MFAAETSVDRITDFTRGQDHIDLGQHSFFGLQFLSANAPNYFNADRAWIVNMADGQHVFVAYEGHTTADLEIVVQTTDGSLLTADDFVMH